MEHNEQVIFRVYQEKEKVSSKVMRIWLKRFLETFFSEEIRELYRKLFQTFSITFIKRLSTFHYRFIYYLESIFL